MHRKLDFLFEDRMSEQPEVDFGDQEVEKHKDSHGSTHHHDPDYEPPAKHVATGKDVAQGLRTKWSDQARIKQVAAEAGLKLSPLPIRGHAAIVLPDGTHINSPQAQWMMHGDIFDKLGFLDDVDKYDIMMTPILRDAHWVQTYLSPDNVLYVSSPMEEEGEEDVKQYVERFKGKLPKGMRVVTNGEEIQLMMRKAGFTHQHDGLPRHSVLHKHSALLTKWVMGEKVYLKEGEEPPAGTMVEQGPRGGRFFRLDPNQKEHKDWISQQGRPGNKERREKRRQLRPITIDPERFARMGEYARGHKVRRSANGTELVLYDVNTFHTIVRVKFNPYRNELDQVRDLMIWGFNQEEVGRKAREKREARRKQTKPSERVAQGKTPGKDDILETKSLADAGIGGGIWAGLSSIVLVKPGVMKPKRGFSDTRLFYKRFGAHHDNESKNELAAFKIFELISPGLCPDVFMDDGLGHAMRWVDEAGFGGNAKTVGHWNGAGNQGLPDDMLRDYACISVFDALSGNSDRHGANMMTDGKHIYPIDSGFAFKFDGEFEESFDHYLDHMLHGVDGSIKWHAMLHDALFKIKGHAKEITPIIEQAKGQFIEPDRVEKWADKMIKEQDTKIAEFQRQKAQHGGVKPLGYR